MFLLHLALCDAPTVEISAGAFFAPCASPSDHRARRPRALVHTPARTKKARLSRPALGRRDRPSPHCRREACILALRVDAIALNRCAIGGGTGELLRAR